MEEFTFEDKGFFAYLLTNQHTKQIGIYTISKRIMAFELGLTEAAIDKLVERFQNVHKLIRYNEETREIAIINWGRYNLNKGGKPIFDCVKKELLEVKDTKLIGALIQSIKNDTIKNLFIARLEACTDDTSTIRGQKEKEKEKKDIVHKSAQTPTSDTEDEFEEFWKSYPLKKDKKPAREKFKAARRNHSFEEIMTGAKGYVQDYIKRKGENFEYLKQAKTFLNQEIYMEYQQDNAPQERKIVEMKSIGEEIIEESEAWTNTNAKSTPSESGSGLL
jgi:hypothetical protein